MWRRVPGVYVARVSGTTGVEKRKKGAPKTACGPREIEEASLGTSSAKTSENPS